MFMTLMVKALSKTVVNHFDEKSMSMSNGDKEKVLIHRRF